MLDEISVRLAPIMATLYEAKQLGAAFHEVVEHLYRRKISLVVDMEAVLVRLFRRRKEPALTTAGPGCRRPRRRRTAMSNAR